MNNKGFTLLEIVLVIGIIGILTAAIIPNIGRNQLSAKVATHNLNVNILKSAASMYIIDNPISKIENGQSKIDNNHLLPYLDEDSKMTIDPIIVEKIKGIDENFNIYVNAEGNIVVEPGELIFENNNLKLKKDRNNE